QGLGDLFVCRIAGNIVDAGIAGSIEYAVGVLGVSLVFVLGHEECGAVKAAVAATESDSSISPNIDVLVNAIRPAVERVRSQSGNLLDNAIRENIRLGVQSLHAEPDLQPFVQSGAIEIVGGEYNLSSGIVELIQ
ncbi:MAG: carbonic anhydrase, partial [Dehalococcoidia bacterium]